MEKGIIILNNNKGNKAIYIIINYTSDCLKISTDLTKNILANFNINIIVPKSMPISFIIIEDKLKKNRLRIFNIKKFCYIQKYLYFQDINVFNFNFDIIRNVLFIKQQKGMIINYCDINKNKLKLEEYVNILIYNCIYFNYKIIDQLFLIKIKNLESFNMEKNHEQKKKIKLIEDKKDKIDDDNTKEETNSDTNNFILDKHLLTEAPPKIPSLYNKKYKFEKDKIPNVFYNHLLISNDAIKNKKRFIEFSLTRRVKGKSLNILFYSPFSKY